MGNADRLHQIVPPITSKHMNTLATDFHPLDQRLLPYKSVHAVGNYHNRLVHIRNQVGQLANINCKYYFGWFVEVLEFVVGVEEDVVLVVIAEVEVEEFVDKVVYWFLCLNVEIFDPGLHNQILVDPHKRQQQILVAVVGPLKVHIKVEIILEDIAADRLSFD